MNGLRLEPWSEDDLWLLRRSNEPEMTAYLGGPEPEEKLLARHRRYLDPRGQGQMFRVELDGTVAGLIGYWERAWRGGLVWETGWAVLPECQGLGVAVRAARAVASRARGEGRHRYLHAFPKPEHVASNAVCRKAGFELLGTVDFEYPPGHPIISHDWRRDLAET
ncbi:hypothetical protein GCM10009801_60950 [Streptomyces albiaxialis]|uniref:N-acetyltransferase domain-containing protein n=1 Tax=Streptomyces albiaxialis TaxID=329523 RepID=A0ABN2WIZ8_9ACTN